MLIIRLADSQGSPVDSAEAVLLDAGGDTLYVAGRVRLEPGEYVLFEDSRRGLLSEGMNPVSAVFRKDGKQVVEPYVLTADKCHFSKVSGKDTVEFR